MAAPDIVRRAAGAQRARQAEGRVPRAVRRRLRESCRGPARRAVLRVLLGMTRWSVRAREDARFRRTQLFGLSREVMRRLDGTLRGPGSGGVPAGAAAG